MSQITSDKKFWRSLPEDGMGSNSSFKDKEFQEGASVLEDPISRRTFMKLLAGTTALAGLTGCSLRKPIQNIYPYSRLPEHVLPGRSLFYATSMAIGRDVSGLLVETHEGRPTKIEGNPDHGSNLGKTNALHQAVVLDLYDPDRLQHPLHNHTHNHTKSTWEDFSSWLQSEQIFKRKGSRVGVLIESSMSPLFHSTLARFQRKFSRSRIYRYDPINVDHVDKGLSKVFLKDVKAEYSFENADVVVSIDDDFLSSGLGSVKSALNFSERRDPDHKKGMNRLYVFESALTATGAKADHRIRMRTIDLDKVILQLADALFKSNLVIPTVLKPVFSTVSELLSNVDPVIPEPVLKAVVSDLLASKGKSILTAGNSVSSQVQGLLHVLNYVLKNVGSTVDYYQLPFSKTTYTKRNNADSLKHLVSDVKNDKLDTLIIIGGNPFYNAYYEAKFRTVSDKLKNIVHLTQSVNESSLQSAWVLPSSHFLESWSDLLSSLGEYSVVQPVIRPMYDSKSPVEFLAFLYGSKQTDYQLLRKQFSKMNLAISWKKWLHSGVVQTRVSPETVLVSKWFKQYLSTTQLKMNKDLMVEVVLDQRVLDGRFSNSAWLQELPDGITKLTWDNALLMSPKTAKYYDLKTGDMVMLTSSDRRVEVPIMVVPGYVDYDMKIAFGFGRKKVGRIGSNSGFDVSELWSKDGVLSAKISKTGKRYELVTTQDHGDMHGRPLYRSGDLSEYTKNPFFAREMVEHPELKSLWKDHKYDTGYQWGMVIDLSKCTGCNACIVACQSENNIPIVGKKQVANGREMHWIRVDRYFEGDKDNPKVAQMPVTCMHCENAPCEQVCPVAATVHSDEGLNDMVYNRCIGTRYCSDNCPTKVRRFNFFDYHQRNPQSVKKDRKHIFDLLKEPHPKRQKQFNPDVTVRMRGVMEKCTFCVQRINHAKSMAKVEDKNLVDGDVVTACQQACPSNAIIFGDIRNQKAEVTKAMASKRQYHLLSELNLRPRLTYLASIRNEHPDLLTHNIHANDHGKKGTYERSEY